MRYLVTWKIRPIPPQMAKTALALLKASDAYTEELKKAGNIIEVWAKADGSGGGCIGEADSHEAGYKMMMGNPYTPFLEYTLTPLIAFKLASDTAKKFLKKLAGE